MEDLEQIISSEEDRRWCVYIHRNKINNKAYIGITSQNPKDRWGSNGYRYREEDHQVFYRAIQKYGWENFEHIIWASELTEKDAKHCEKLLIALFKTNCTKYRTPEFGYNMTDGGDGIIRHVFTEESRKRMSVSQKIRFSDPKNRIIGLRRFGENNPNYGNHKLAGENNPNYGNCKSVIQLSLDNQFIKKYRNAKEVEVNTGIFATQIHSVCIHKPHYNSAGGFKWLYEEEYDLLYNNEKEINVK